ncbi:DUF3306 domain-containing protein [Noviherbaspirillum saxi]|uniref:DUF3306 domain-containing protein n=1 Tax=Noviherbaspirillum saxi TaxID=2320863 RepID=A0A3A3FW23_9BURK|nr:DUF3306 domain-containing protein [Noviherbaspirillum saxi]RJF99830.1 DUF3306 domain-containing protein [Noviherbaspirillum saxi]
MEAESFFARWSKRNAEAAQEKQAPATDLPESQETPKPPPTIEDVAALTPESDFKPFVARGVDETVRRSAMKKLFADPHFNVMDGLDVYIDDYNTFDPIPPAMLAMLNHAKGLLDPLSQTEHPLMRLLQTVPDSAQAEEPATDASPDTPPEEQAASSSVDVDQDAHTTPDPTSDDNPV